MISNATETSVAVEPKHPAPASARRCKVAYLTSRFPVLTETFILNEMLAVERHGVRIELYPLLRMRPAIMHPEARPWVQRAHYHPFLSWRIVRANLHFLAHKPRAYLGALWTLLRGTLGSRRFFFGGLALFPKIVYFARLMKDQGVTHVHAHFAHHPAAAALVIRRLTGIPYSFTAHGSDLHRDRHMLREKVAEATTVVTISNYNKRIIVEHCGERFADKIVVIHCGIDVNRFQPPRQDAPGRLLADPFSILCIGTLHPVKGHKYLIEACRLLRERGLNIRCHLVGDGPDRATLFKQAVAADLADRIYFPGQCEASQVARLLGNAHLVAAPSVPTRDGRREGIPVAIMEAMASGVPVVASNLSGIPELVEDGSSGLLVPPGDATALADAIEQIHDTPQFARRLVRAAREKVVEHFNLHCNAALLARRFRRGDQS